MSGDRLLDPSPLVASLRTVGLKLPVAQGLPTCRGRRRHGHRPRGLHPPVDRRPRCCRIVAPVALLLWVYGLHYALSALVTELPYPTVSRYGLAMLNGLRGIGALLALMWLLARIGRGIEAAMQSFAARTEGRVDDLLLPIVGTGIRLMLPLLAIILGAPLLAVPERMQALFSNAHEHGADRRLRLHPVPPGRRQPATWC